MISIQKRAAALSGTVDQSARESDVIAGAVLRELISMTWSDALLKPCHFVFAAWPLSFPSLPVEMYRSSFGAGGMVIPVALQVSGVESVGLNDPTSCSEFASNEEMSNLSDSVSYILPC